MYTQCVSIPDLIKPSPVAFDALQLIDDAVICTDENGIILLFNSAAERAFGYSAAEAIGQSVEMLLPFSDRTNHRLQVKGYLLENANVHRVMGGKREVIGRHKDGTEFSTEAIISRHVVGGSTILTVVHRDITERIKWEQQQEVIARELDHRIRNIFSVVNSLVALTAPGADNVKDFKSALLRRLSTLARTQGVLRQGASLTTDLKEVLLDEIATYHNDDESNVVIHGPRVEVGPDAAQSLALIFHELATNSAKYGALSSKSGILAITYALTGEGDSDVTIKWRESNGPQILPPERHGFGTMLIKQVVQSTFGVDVSLEYPPEGFCCRMILPYAKVVGGPKGIPARSQ